MNKWCVVAALLVLLSFDAHSQEDSPVSAGSFFGLNAARYEPAVLGRDFEHFSVSVINTYAWFGNTTFSRYELEQIGRAEIPDIDAVVNRLKKNNRLGFGATVEPLNFALRINNKGQVKTHGLHNKIWCPGDYFKQERFTVSFGVADRVEFNLKYAGDIFKLAWQGNKQFEGQFADLFVYANAFYTREWTVGFAKPIELYNKHGIWKYMDYRIGGRVKYIQGLGVARTAKSDNQLYTDVDGRFLSLTYDYDYRYAADIDNFNPLKGPGRGAAVDLGFTAHYKTRLYANVNLLDVGWVRFRENTTRYANSGGIQFNGVVTGSLFSEDIIIDGEEFEEIYQDVETKGEKFTIAYPARFRMHLAYRVPGTNRREQLYHKHSVGFTYIQGFMDFGNATIVPFFAGSYAFNLWDVFEVGTNVGLSGYNRAEFGAFMAFHLGPIRFGIGSGNITPIFPKFGTGADFNFNFTVAH